MLPAQLSQYPILPFHSTAAAVLASLVLCDQILRLCDKILGRCDRILTKIASLARTIRRIKKEWNAP
jgi:hypothetical protein